MLCYDRIDASEGIDVNKSGRLKECMMCHYWYFLDTGYRYEAEVCNGCDDISIMVFELNIKGIDYLCGILYISKSHEINRFNNSKFDVKGLL